MTPYRPIKPGVYVVAMRLHGAAASSPAGLRWTLHARAGQAYAVAAAGANNDLTGVVLRDTLKALTRGHGLVRMIQAASRAPAARLVASPHLLLAAHAKFASSTPYTSVSAGAWTVRASSLTHQLSATKRVTVRPGSVSSVVVLDAKGGGIQLRMVEDASGAAVAPTGSIDAGGGGTASRPASNVLAVALPAGLAPLFVLGAVTAPGRRRDRASARVIRQVPPDRA